MAGVGVLTGVSWKDRRHWLEIGIMVSAYSLESYRKW